MSHTTPHIELAASLEAAKKQISIGAVYRHFRSGDDYEVLSISLCEWDEAPAVIYRRLGDPDRLTWIRPVHGPSGWLTPALHDGADVVRFQLVS